MQEQLQTRSAIDTYPKRAQSYLKQAFNKAQLSVVGGLYDGRVPREREYGDHLPENPYAGVMTPEGAAFASRYPGVMEGLLISPDNRAERYMVGVGGYDFHNIPEMGREITEGNNASPVVLRTVFGGTSEMQFRALSMLLPQLQQMEAIAKVDGVKPPQMQVIFANHIASHINGLDLKTLQANVRGLIDIADAYIETFFPGLAKHVVFLEDAPVEEGSYIKNELDRLTEIAERVLPDVLKEKLAAKQNGQGNGTSIRYAAAHVLMHDTNAPDFLRPVETNRTEAIVPGQIISTGGAQERDFYTARFHLRPHVEDALPTAQFTSRHGSAPYYAARGGDISLHSVLTQQIDLRNLQDVDKHVEFDINYWLAVSDNRGGKAKTDNFIQTMREREA